MSGSHKADLVSEIVVAIQDEQTQQAFMSNAIAERLDVTSTELEVLGTLVARGPLSASDISARTGLTSGAVTRLIDRLEQRGSVRRRPDANDRRRVLVEITSGAQHICEPFYGPLAREGTRLLEGLTEKELETILKYLQVSYALTKKHTERISAMPERPYLPKRKVNIKGRVLGQTIRIKI